MKLLLLAFLLACAASAQCIEGAMVCHNGMVVYCFNDNACCEQLGQNCPGSCPGDCGCPGRPPCAPLIPRLPRRLPTIETLNYTPAPRVVLVVALQGARALVRL